MFNGLGAGTGITNIASFYPSPVQAQITDLPSFYPTAPYVPTSPVNYSGGAPSSGSIPAAVIQAAVTAGLTPTQFTQQAVNAGYSPTQWAAMAAAQRQAALASGALPSGAPSPLTSANMTPILLIGGAVLLFVMMRK